jgi:hypothetical protein
MATQWASTASMSAKRSVMVIPKEKAVFRLDGRGRWCNVHGVFRNRKIIDYFHSAIRRDDNGYFVCQEREDVTEKVYFPYEDTALFVFDVIISETIVLVLNTKAKLTLSPENLFIANDSLYIRRGDERIKFTERALMKLTDTLEFAEGAYYIRLAAGRFPIAEESRTDGAATAPAPDPQE